MNAFHFANPGALALLIAVPLLAAAYRYGERRRHAALTAWGRAPAALADPRRRAWKRGLQLAACAMLAIALARPAVESATAAAPTPTGDVVFLLDVSRSMLSDDARPSRLLRGREIVRELAALAKGQRLALVAFAGSQSVECPLTLDHAFFEEMVNAAGPESVTLGGTKLGAAMRFAAAHAFDDVERDSKTLVVISDGGDQKSDPVGAAREAGRRGIRVVAIGVGDPNGEALVPESMYDRTPVMYQGRAVSTHLDGVTLGAIGEYVAAGVGRLDAADVYRRLLAPARGQSKKAASSGDTAWMACLAVAVLLLAVEFRVPERRLVQAAVLALVVLAMPVASFAQTVEEWFAKGVKALDEKRYQDAVHYFADASRWSPGAAEVRFDLGKALYGFQSYTEAAGSFEMAANATPEVQFKARCKLGQGNALFRDAEQLHGPPAAARMRAAIAAYREALALDPDLFDAEFNRKVAERRLQELLHQPAPPDQDPGSTPTPAASDAESVLKETSARVPPSAARARGRSVERDW